MEERRRRLAKLVKLQGQVKAVHEARTARHRSAAIAAGEDARAIAERAEAEDSMSSLFPDLYHTHHLRARDRQRVEDAKADREAGLAAVAGLRGDVVSRAYREVAQEIERATAEKEILEFVERGAASARPK
jgi:hypothetical protein